MTFIDKLKCGRPTLSYEVFPPKNPAEWGALYETLGRLSKLSPDFISVTYRGGVSTRARTVELVERIQRELEIEAVAHLTCITHTKHELREILFDLQRVGVHNIIALRGDLPKKERADALLHASDLIKLTMADFHFTVACAFYPEKHPDAPTLAEDISYLKYKQDCGASYAVSQFFFDNEAFYRFRDQAAAAGVTIPLVAGIMPVSNLAQLRTFKELSGTEVPTKLLDFLNNGDIATVTERGVDYGANQCEDLLKNGVSGIHLYTLNKSKSTFQIGRRLSALTLDTAVC
jgi:methylenetetrahydrofolate reductase (NADPH)